MLMVGLVPAVGVAQDQSAEVVSTPAPTVKSTPASSVNPYGLEANGLIPPTFEGPWRFRIAVNGWAPNFIEICADAGMAQDCLRLDYGFVFSYRLKYFVPVDFETRKGAFGAYLHTLFYRFQGNTGSGQPQLDYDDTLSLIDVGVSYEVGRWALGEGPSAAQVTLEPIVGARLQTQPVEVSLRGQKSPISTATYP